jgi:hypothetical protein
VPWDIEFQQAFQILLIPVVKASPLEKYHSKGHTHDGYSKELKWCDRWGAGRDESQSWVQTPTSILITWQVTLCDYHLKEG